MAQYTFQKDKTFKQLQRFIRVSAYHLNNKKGAVLTHLNIELWHTNEGVCYVCQDTMRGWWV